MSVPHLILVPGLMCDDIVWDDQARKLGTPAGIRIADHGSMDSLGTMAEAILGRAPARFALAGHSMGGRVALEVFRRAPERIAGIALLDTAHAPLPAGAEGKREIQQRHDLLAKARREGMRAMAAQWAENMVHPSRLSDPHLMGSIHDMIARKTPDIFAAQIKALIARPSATELLSRIGCPALVLCGRQDSWSVVAKHEEMAAMIPGSRLVIVEACGHMSTMERPGEVTAAMQEWLRNTKST
jgi:pimeloyl-ACP methyl ester carboxylesterase